MTWGGTRLMLDERQTDQDLQSWKLDSRLL